ncbi:MAG: hypothetical protein HYZ50_23715 [Deltaproteobacteria bacterium]|nr:hypothetical protein [Deltaproteobacteria bacterium]
MARPHRTKDLFEIVAIRESQNPLIYVALTTDDRSVHSFADQVYSTPFICKREDVRRCI